jgi:hypothetical protein
MMGHLGIFLYQKGRSAYSYVTKQMYEGPQGVFPPLDKLEWFYMTKAFVKNICINCILDK